MHPATRSHFADWWDEVLTEGHWAASWRASLDALTAEQAAWSPAPERHSIWQIVLHMVFWREVALRRARTGQGPTPDERARLNFPEITDRSEAAWTEAKRRLEDTHARIAAALRDPNPANDALAEFLPHDAYHFGQINYLRAMQGMEPID
ncbi:MAG TPA: DinB family protein [Phycisphaerales bacterium]|nr:DinB family protein [Phycisphaerales bacterium]